MRYGDFYDIATYGNDMWKGNFTPKEIAENAYIYYADFQWSKANDTIAHSIKELAKLLTEDGTEECQDWLQRMAEELDLIDMDWRDYI